jgi:Uma2 family endonuclease
MAAPARLTVHEYFALDEASEVKHELVDGVPWAVAGGTPAHSLLAANAVASLANRLRGGPCRTFNSDLRVSVTDRTFAYPDATVVCGELQTHPQNADTVTNPVLVVEVLSPTTEIFDRGRKREFYALVPSMRAVVLVSSERAVVEVVERRGDDWSWQLAEGLDSSVLIHALGVDIPLAELYAQVDLPAS